MNAESEPHRLESSARFHLCCLSYPMVVSMLPSPCCARRGFKYLQDFSYASCNVPIEALEKRLFYFFSASYVWMDVKMCLEKYV